MRCIREASLLSPSSGSPLLYKYHYQMTRARCPFHPYAAVAVCTFFSRLLFLSLLCFSPVWEHWRLRWKVTSEVRPLASTIKASCSAAKSCQVPPPRCLPQTPGSVCLSLSFSSLLMTKKFIFLPCRQSLQMPSDTFAWAPKAACSQGDVRDVAYRCAYQWCLSMLPEGRLSPSAVEMALQSLWCLLMGIWPSSWADKSLLFPLEKVIEFFSLQAQGIRAQRGKGSWKGTGENRGFCQQMWTGCARTFLRKTVGGYIFKRVKSPCPRHKGEEGEEMPFQMKVTGSPKAAIVSKGSVALGVCRAMGEVWGHQREPPVPSVLLSTWGTWACDPALNQNRSSCFGELTLVPPAVAESVYLLLFAHTLNFFICSRRHPALVQGCEGHQPQALLVPGNSEAAVNTPPGVAGEHRGWVCPAHCQFMLNWDHRDLI